METRIFWAGDSTVKQNDISSYPQTGIGQGFSLYINRNVSIRNYAENGRSTKSYIEEGHLATIDHEIQEGDFLFIQFGHNDEKPDIERHTEPYGSYQQNLMKYARVANKHGAHPVFITPLYRRLFQEDGTLVPDTHLEYPKAMLELGKKLEIPVIDLCSASYSYLEALGDEKTKHLFMHLLPGEYKNYPKGKTDNTHLVYAGAVTFAGMIADHLKKLGGVYAALLLPEVIDTEDPNLLID